MVNLKRLEIVNQYSTTYLGSNISKKIRRVRGRMKDFKYISSHVEAIDMVVSVLALL